MNRIMVGAMIPLLAAGLVAGCSGQADRSESNAAAAPGAAAPKHHPSNALTAATDCRAGCQRDFNGCQESTQSAVFNASPGYHLLPDTVAKIGVRKGNPGLRSEPKWITDRYPRGSAKPTSIIVRPDLATCHGEDQHTQGVNWYDFQVLQAQ